MKAESNIKMNTFENFIEDDSNKFAFAACRAIIDKSAWEFNPLWLYGPSGCGKTHLLDSIAHKYESDKSKKILYSRKCRYYSAIDRSPADSIFCCSKRQNRD